MTGKASIDVRPAATTTYSLTATSPIGSSTRSLMVTVMPPPVISSFAATPASIGYGWPSSLSWSVTGAVSVEVEPGVGPVVGAGTVVDPLATTTYTLRATNVVASTTASTTVIISGNTWSSGPAMPTARFYAGGAVTGGKIYVMGRSGSSVFSTLEVFNLSSNAWDTLAPMASGRWGLAAVPWGGKILAVGGSPSSRSVEEFDPVSNGWSPKAPMPTGRGELGLVEVNGRIYAIGGSVDGIGTPTGVVETYDPAADAWESTGRRAMPTPRWGFGIAAVDGKILTIGGRDASDPVHQTALVEAYDPASDTWSSRAPMSTVRQGLVAVAVNGRIEQWGRVIRKRAGVGQQYNPTAESMGDDSIPGDATTSAGGRHRGRGQSVRDRRNDQRGRSVCAGFQRLLVQRSLSACRRVATIRYGSCQECGPPVPHISATERGGPFSSDSRAEACCRDIGIRAHRLGQFARQSESSSRPWPSES